MPTGADHGQGSRQEGRVLSALITEPTRTPPGSRFPAARLRTGLEPAGGHLGAGQARHRQPRRSRPGADHAGREASTQADPVPPGPGRRLSRRHMPRQGRLTAGRNPFRRCRSIRRPETCGSHPPGQRRYLWMPRSGPSSPSRHTTPDCWRSAGCRQAWSGTTRRRRTRGTPCHQRKLRTGANAADTGVTPTRAGNKILSRSTRA